MFKLFLERALKFFSLQKRTDSVDTTKYTSDYNDKSAINVAYIGSNALSNLVTSDSTINITTESGVQSPRLELLQNVFIKEWLKIKIYVQRVLGIGKIALVPYVNEYNKIVVDQVMQNQFMIVDDDGEQPTSVIIAADTAMVGTNKYGKGRRYLLLEGDCYITEFYANISGGGISEEPPAGTGWVKTDPIVIANCSKLPLAFITSPIDNRSDDKYLGVPITEGADEIIKQIKTAQEDINREFRVAKSFVMIDKNMTKTNTRGKSEVLDEVFKTVPMDSQDNKPFAFSPQIRHDPLFYRLEQAYKLLERHIGVSDGIFSDPKNVGQYNNQSNIKRSVMQTFAFVGSVRTAVELGFKDLLLACDVLSEFYSLTPVGHKEEFDLQFNWSNALIEDSVEEFTQVLSLQGIKALSTPEARQWFTKEPLEIAEEKVQEILDSQPVMDFGFGNDMTNFGSGADEEKEKEKVPAGYEEE